MKGTYQLPTCTLMKLLHSNICDMSCLSSLALTSPIRGIMNSATRASNVLMIFRIVKKKSLSWAKAKVKFNLILTKVGNWITFATKVLAQWRHMLDNYMNIMLPGQWIGLCKDIEADLTFVMQCSTTFIPSYIHYYHFSMPLPIKCSTVGTHS